MLSSRYNLKRRVASLPPLSAEIFNEKVLANKATAAATAAKASFEKACAACNKTYFSENAYQNHLGSQRHRINVARRGTGAGDGDDATSVMSSTFSLGDSLAESNGTLDQEAEAEFVDVVQKMKGTAIDEKEEDATSPVSRRPSRPHHSGASEARPEHPLSDTTSSQQTSRTPSVANSTQESPDAPLRSCMFCSYTSPSFPLNMDHMFKIHSLFIPEKDFLVDLEGLTRYLYEKVTIDHECLYCGKAKFSTHAIQTHMKDRGHNMIAFNTEDEMLEIGEFYDFSSTYSDPEDEVESDDDGSNSTSKGGVNLGARRSEQTVGADGESLPDAEEDGWETDSTISDVPTDEITSVPIDDRSHRYAQLKLSRHHSHNDPRPHRNADGWHSRAHPTPHAVYHDEFELHLPSGRTAGHRSLNKYYRQNLRNYPSPAERESRRAITAGSGSASSGDEEMSDADNDRPSRGREVVTRANGGLGMIGVDDAKKKEVRAIEKRHRREQLRQRNRYQAGNEKRGNFQKHYRVSNPHRRLIHRWLTTCRILCYNSRQRIASRWRLVHPQWRWLCCITGV